MNRLNLHLILLAGLLTGGVNGAEDPGPPDKEPKLSVRERIGPLAQVYRSASQQFFVVGHIPGAPKGPPSLSQIREGHLQLDPSVLAITCELVKLELLNYLKLDDKWQSTISVVVNGTAPPESNIGVAAIAGSRGYTYRLELPGQIPKQRLVRSLVRALLLEIINRQQNGGRFTEVPRWLQEGLAAHMFAQKGDILLQGITARVFGLDGPKMVTDARTQTTFDRTYEGSLAAAFRHLQLTEPLGFNQLNLPDPGQLTGYGWKTYQHSSHLFIAELLRLQNGPEALAELLLQLPKFLNPQLALLKAYKQHFRTALELDKWWSLVLVDFRSRGPNLRWGQSRALEHLNEIMYAPMVIRADTNSVPITREMHFQQLIQDTDFIVHKKILQHALRKLSIVQLNANRDLARLINDYRLTLDEYIRKREGSSNSRKELPTSVKLTKKKTIEQLDLLDGIRFDYKLVASPEPEKPMDLERIEKLLNK